MFEFPHTESNTNHVVQGKEYIMQHTKRGFRCISWSPHYIMTEWTKRKRQAILDADALVNKYYNENVAELADALG